MFRAPSAFASFPFLWLHNCEQGRPSAARPSTRLLAFIFLLLEHAASGTGPATLILHIHDSRISQGTRELQQLSLLEFGLFALNNFIFQVNREPQHAPATILYVLFPGRGCSCWPACKLNMAVIRPEEGWRRRRPRTKPPRRRRTTLPPTPHAALLPSRPSSFNPLLLLLRLRLASHLSSK